MVAQSNLAPGSVRHDRHMKAVIIDMDEIKKQQPDYTPSNAEEYHEISSKLSKEAFKIILKVSDYKKVILMGGGSASGKTEFASSQLTDEKVIVFDGTLSSIPSLREKIAQVKKMGKEIEVCLIIPSDILVAFDTFVKRTRRAPEDVFFSTHSGCRKTAMWLVKNNPSIKISIFKSIKDASTMRELSFTSSLQRDKFIKELQKTETELQKQVTRKV